MIQPFLTDRLICFLFISFSLLAAVFQWRF